jgi:magnesium-transporting ATPase (P-type)
MDNLNENAFEPLNNLTNNNLTFTSGFRTDRQLLDNSTSRVGIVKDTTFEELELLSVNLIKVEKQTFLNSGSFVLCLSGSSMKHILDSYKRSEKTYQLTNLLRLIKIYGIIYYRMSPIDKVLLVELFKEDKSNIVAMVGDGANDCGAMLASDAGISICHKKENSVTAHFFCKAETIKCVQVIITNCRACYENTVIVFKFMILQTIIQIATVVFVFKLCMGDMSQTQYFIIDAFLVLFACMFTSK